MRLLSSLGRFIEQRSGLFSAFRALFEPGPNDENLASRITDAFWNTLLILFVVQCLTGVLLSLTYTPSSLGAWASVVYLQQKIVNGWFLRGIHSYAGEAMLLVFAVHLLQLVWSGAYRKPQELRWWLTLVFGGLILALLISGLRLPWDQHSYWALQVELNIAAAMPLIGQPTADLIAGGARLGQSTLTRLYAGHAILLPAVAIAVLWAMAALRKRHGPARGAFSSVSGSRWSSAMHLLVSLVFALAVLLAVAALTVALEGRSLTAPADPSHDYPARPEWFLLPLFMLRMLLPDSLELVATVVAPGLLALFLFALPLLDRSSQASWLRRLGWLIPVLLVFVGAGLLTERSMAEDAVDQEHQEALHKAAERAERSLELASWGVPPEGPLAMLHRDPFTRGKEIYAQYCLSCHVLAGEGERKAPDHTGFASRKWIRMLLEAPEDDHFFGQAGLAEDMPSQSSLGDEALTQVTEFLYAMGEEPPDRERHPDATADPSLVKAGEVVFRRKCMRCHVLEGDGDFMEVGAPNMTGWASRTWTLRQIAHPDAPTQYGELNEMPAFDDQLTKHDLRMVTGYLRAERFKEPDFQVEIDED